MVRSARQVILQTLVSLVLDVRQPRSRVLPVAPEVAASRTPTTSRRHLVTSSRRQTRAPRRSERCDTARSLPAGGHGHPAELCQHPVVACGSPAGPRRSHPAGR